MPSHIDNLILIGYHFLLLDNLSQVKTNFVQNFKTENKYWFMFYSSFFKRENEQTSKEQQQEQTGKLITLRV